MQAEYGALLANQTWELVPKPTDGHVVTGKWVWHHKLKDDGSLGRYKAHWVVRRFTWRVDVDYEETYCPVVKSAIMNTVFTLAASRS